MLIPLEFIKKKRGLLDPADYEDSIEHAEFTERLRKTFYYGKAPTSDRPSLPVTELAVGFLTDAAPRQLGRVDLTFASDVSREACISPCSMMLGMIYVDRLKYRNPEYLQQVSSSDLFLISMMMASKYLYDEGVDEEVFNDEWAESADMDVEEVNSLELSFLRAIDWELYVRQTEFFDLLDRIERKVARDKGRERGFLTYTDLVVLSGDDRVNQALRAILQQVCKVVVVCSVAYVAGLLTMVGSTFTLVCLQQSLPLQPVLTPHTSLPLPGLPRHHAEYTRSDANWAVDANGSTNNKDYPWTTGHKVSTTPRPDQVSQGTEEEEGKAPGAIGMSGLLTLAFIKDAVVHFVMSMKSTQRQDSLPDLTRSSYVPRWDARSEDTEDHVVCTCGCCTGAAVDGRRHCVNVTVHRDAQTDNMDNANSRLQWERRGEHGQTSDRVDNANSRLGWGRQAENMDNANSRLRSERQAENMDNANSRLRWERQAENTGCELGARCCCRRLSRWQPAHGGTTRFDKSQVDRPLHNVVLGFWTTAEAVVT